MADHFEVVQGNAQIGAPGRPLDSLVVLRVVDDRGVPMAGIPVTWSVVAGGGRVTRLVDTTGADGTVTATWTLGDGIGLNTLSATTLDLDAAHLSATAEGLEAVDVAVARNAVCTVSEGGAIWCWGDGGRGGFFSGESHFDYGPRPVLVDSGHSFVAIAAGDTHFCAITIAREMWCWGEYAWMLGRGASPAPPRTPAPVGGGHLWNAMAAADEGMLAVDETGQMWRWGRVWEGEFQEGEPVSTGPAGAAVVAVSSGYEHSCALELDGTAWCGGHGDLGQLGDSTRGSGGWGRVTTDTKFRQIAIGDHWTCGAAVGGGLYCWGASPDHPNYFDRAPRRLDIPAGIGLVSATWDALLLDRRGQVSVFNTAGFNAGGILVAGAAFGAEAPLPGLGVVKMNARAPTACMIRVDHQVTCVGDVPGFGPAPTPVGIPAP